MADRLFKVINNDTGTQSEYGVIDSGGGGPGAGNGGGGVIPPLWKVDVVRDVQIAKWGLAGLLALIGLFYWLAYLPDTKEIRNAIASINTNVAVQTRDIGDINNSLTRIEEKIDANHAQASAGAGQAGAVRSGTRGPAPR